MQSDAKSILEMAHGAIMERVDYETARLMDNIMDPNTDPTKRRKITLDISFKPDKNRQMIEVSVTAKSSLAPTEPIAISLYTGYERGQFVAVEMSNTVPGQMDVYGNMEAERSMLRFPGDQTGT